MKIFRGLTEVSDSSDMQATVIDPADMEGLESALNNHKVSRRNI